MALPPEVRDRFLENFYKNKSVRFPSLAQLFPGLEGWVEAALIQAGREKDMALCAAVAAVPAPDQRIFLNRALIDLHEAQHWASTPAWKRPIIAGDEDDERIWRFVLAFRLICEALAMERSVSLASQGEGIVKMSGLLSHLTAPRRLADVLYQYGRAVRDGLDLGDVTRPPWKERP